MRILSICLLGLVCFSGCENIRGRTHPEIISKNKQILSSGGEEVGTLPDGRPVVRYEIDMGDVGHNHFIYVVSGSDSITKNGETGGKHSFNSVQAEISE